MAYRPTQPIASIGVPLSTVRGLYVLLGQLMERHADTRIAYEDEELGTCDFRSIQLVDTSEDVERGYTDSTLTLIMHCGSHHPPERCENPAALDYVI